MRPRRGGLAGAEIAGERDDVARDRSAARDRPSDARSRSRSPSATENVVGRHHSAALRCASWSIGKVARDGRAFADRPDRRAPCRRAARRRNAPATGRGRRRDAATRCGWLSNQSNTLSLTSGGMPGPESVTLKTTLCSVRRALMADGGVMRRESDGVGEQIIEHLHHAALVAGEVADAGIDVDLEL